MFFEISCLLKKANKSLRISDNVVNLSHLNERLEKRKPKSATNTIRLSEVYYSLSLKYSMAFQHSLPTNEATTLCTNPSILNGFAGSLIMILLTLS